MVYYPIMKDAAMEQPAAILIQARSIKYVHSRICAKIDERVIKIYLMFRSNLARNLLNSCNNCHHTN